MSFRRARLPLGPGSSEGSLWGGGVHRAGLQEAVSAKIPVVRQSPQRPQLMSWAPWHRHGPLTLLLWPLASGYWMQAALGEGVTLSEVAPFQEGIL